MAFSPVAFIAPNYRDYKNYWLKFYEPGTTTPKPIALEADGGTQVAKLQLSIDGFVVSAGGAIVMPYVNSSYDGYLFPTEAEADNNDTANAIRVADDITGVNGAILANSVVTKFDTLQDVIDEKSTLLIYDGAALNLSGRNSKGDGGGAMWDVVDSSSVTVNGANIVALTGVSGLSAVLRVEDIVLSQWGLPSASLLDNANILNIVCDYAYENGIETIKCDVDATIDPSTRVQHKSNVIFYGSGSLNGLYRVRVHKTLCADHNFFNNIKKENISQFSKALNPVVVIMGDSISSAGEGSQGPGGTIGFGSTQWAAITDKIKQDNPNKDISFYNRAIGGQTWLNANDNTRPSVGVTQWYTVDQPWLDYIEALEPDLLFLGFGMNDSNGFNAGAMVAAVNKIKAWDKVPSLVFITTPAPSLAAEFPDGEGFGFSGEVFQEGRDQVASFTRGYCDFYGYGYLDVNRQFSQVRDGYDPCRSNLVRTTTDAVPANGVYTATTGCRDFNIVGTITGNAASIKDIFNGVNGVLTCRVGLNTSDLVFFNNSGSDTIQVQLNAGGLNSYEFIDTGVTFPTTDFTLTVDVVNTTLHILLNDTKILETPIVRQAALFPVQFGYQGFSAGPFSLITFSRGQSVTVGKTSTDLEIWGVSNNDADVKLPSGGNGVNHYASAGVDKVVRPVLEQSDFSVGDYQDDAISPYPLTTNEHFINWTGAECDNWARQAGVFGTETAGGIHGSPTSIVFGAYPCGYGQDITARLSRELAKYKLIVVARNGSIFSNTSAGYVNPHSTIVVLEYNDGSPQSVTINIPETLFGSNYESKEFDLEKLAGIDWPNLSQITSMEVRIYMTNNCQLGYLGIHEADSARITYFNPLI